VSTSPCEENDLMLFLNIKNDVKLKKKKREVETTEQLDEKLEAY